MKKLIITTWLISALALSGCAVGFNAQTNIQGNSGNGRTANISNIQIRNAVIVVDEKDQTKATLIASVINTADKNDSLSEIIIDPAINITFSKIDLLPNKPTSIGYNSSLVVQLSTSGASLAPGRFIDVKFIFANNEPVELSLLVVANTGYYSDVQVPEIKQSESPSAIPSPS